MLDYILDDIILSVSTLYTIIVLVKSFEEFLITAELLRVLLRMELKKKGKLDGRVITEFRNKRRTK